MRSSAAAFLIVVIALAPADAGARGPWAKSDSEAIPAAKLEDPSANSVLFCPTPVTLPRGSFYLRNHELFVFNVGYAPLDRLDLHAMYFAVVPFGKADDRLNGQVGFKLAVLDVEGFPLRISAVGSLMKYREERFDNIGAVAGINGRWGGVNYLLTRAVDEEGRAQPFEMLGFELRPNDMPLKYFIEYTIFHSFVDGSRSGVIALGIKGFSSRFSFSTAFAVPATEDWLSSFADERSSPFPLLSFSWRW
jgi:hypothetical protein